MYKHVFVIQTDSIMDSNTQELIINLLTKLTADSIVTSLVNQSGYKGFLVVPNASKDGLSKNTKL